MSDLKFIPDKLELRWHAGIAPDVDNEADQKCPARTACSRLKPFALPFHHPKKIEMGDREFRRLRSVGPGKWKRLLVTGCEFGVLRKVLRLN